MAPGLVEAVERTESYPVELGLPGVGYRYAAQRSYNDPLEQHQPGAVLESRRSAAVEPQQFLPERAVRAVECRQSRRKRLAERWRVEHGLGPVAGSAIRCPLRRPQSRLCRRQQ